MKHLPAASDPNQDFHALFGGNAKPNRVNGAVPSRERTHLTWAGATGSKEVLQERLGKKVHWAIFAGQRIWRGREQKRGLMREADFSKRKKCGDVHWYVDARITATIAIAAARSTAIALELPA